MFWAAILYFFFQTYTFACIPFSGTVVVGVVVEAVALDKGKWAANI